jgi:hypothetical protein
VTTGARHLGQRRAINLLQEHPDPELEETLRGRLQAFSPSSCTPPEAIDGG